MIWSLREDMAGINCWGQLVLKRARDRTNKNIEIIWSLLDDLPEVSFWGQLVLNRARVRTNCPTRTLKLSGVCTRTWPE